MNDAIIQYNKIVKFLIIVAVRCGVFELVDNRKRICLFVYLSIVYSVLVVAQCILHK